MWSEILSANRSELFPFLFLRLLTRRRKTPSKTCVPPLLLLLLLPTPPLYPVYGPFPLLGRVRLCRRQEELEEDIMGRKMSRETCEKKKFSLLLRSFFLFPILPLAWKKRDETFAKCCNVCSFHILLKERLAGVNIFQAKSQLWGLKSLANPETEAPNGRLQKLEFRGIFFFSEKSCPFSSSFGTIGSVVGALFRALGREERGRKMCHKHCEKKYHSEDTRRCMHAILSVPYSNWLGPLSWTKAEWMINVFPL